MGYWTDSTTGLLLDLLPNHTSVTATMSHKAFNGHFSPMRGVNTSSIELSMAMVAKFWGVIAWVVGLVVQQDFCQTWHNTSKNIL